MLAEGKPWCGKEWLREGTILVLAMVVLLTGVQRSAAHGSYHAVVAKLENALASDPDHAGLRFQLARAHSEHEEWRLCLEEVARVDALAPGKYATGWLRGVSFYQAGKQAEAKAELDRFLLANPEHVDALFDRARVSMTFKDTGAAAADCVKALEHAPDSEVERWIFAADCLRADARASAAVEQIEKGLKHLGKDPLLFREALALDTDLERWDSALARIDELRQVAPKPEPWMAERARLLSRAGRAEESRRSWQALLEHLGSLPGLDRGTAFNLELAAQARAALGLPPVLRATAPPAPARKSSSSP